MNKEEREEALTKVAFEIIGEFEALLSDKGIKIPNKERTGEGKDTACIFGSDYYRLEEEVKGILKYYELL